MPLCESAKLPDEQAKRLKVCARDDGWNHLSTKDQVKACNNTHQLIGVHKVTHQMIPVHLYHAPAVWKQLEIKCAVFRMMGTAAPIRGQVMGVTGIQLSRLQTMRAQLS